MTNKNANSPLKIHKNITKGMFEFYSHKLLMDISINVNNLHQKRLL